MSAVSSCRCCQLPIAIAAMQLRFAQVAAAMPSMSIAFLSIAILAGSVQPSTRLLADQQPAGGKTASLAETATIQLKRDPESTSARFIVEGIAPARLVRLRNAGLESEQWQQVLAVYVVTAGKANPHALFGAHRVVESTIQFEPRFSLSPGLTYRAVFHPGKLPDSDQLPDDNATPVVNSFTIPAAPAPPAARVEAVYPTSNVLPENLLKFYIHFSAPMRRGEAYNRIRLEKESGEEITDPFLEIGEELWDYSGTRFTLFFHPGRIKRGLKPREELGPALELGQAYRLVIDRQWPDATGQPLTKSFVKHFRIAEPDDVQPDINRWQLVTPRAESKEALTIHFEEPLDHAMLQRVINIVNGDNQLIDGQIEIDRGERRWQFRPARPWQQGEYSMVVASVLEDLAGNSLEKPFEVDVFEKVDRTVKAETRTIKFTLDSNSRTKIDLSKSHRTKTQ